MVDVKVAVVVEVFNVNFVVNGRIYYLVFNLKETLDLLYVASNTSGNDNS